MPETFGKNKKLKKASEIEFLFKKGKGKTLGNLRVVYVKIPDESQPENSKIGVSISKKFFKRAVDRNRIKRLLRECYRHNKEIFADAFGNEIFAMIIWQSAQMPSGFQELERIFLELCEKKKN